MIELKELVSLITKHKVKNIDVIVNESMLEDTKFNSLFGLVRDGVVESDEAARLFLYGQSSKSQSSYNKLKNRLKTRLLNTLFFIDINQPQFSDIEKAFITCTKNWMAVRLLMLKGARNTAIRLAERTLRISLKHEFTELIIFLAKELRFHYSLVQPHSKKYDRLNRILEIHTRTLTAELVAEKYYTEIMREFGESQHTSKPESLSRSVLYSEDLLSKYPDINSYRYIRISYLLHIIRYQINRNFEDAIQASQTAIRLIENKPYSSEGAIFSFKLRLLSCYVQLHKFEEGERVALRYIKQLDDGSRNWFLVMFYYFILSSHSQQYNQCYRIIQTVISNEMYESLYPNLKQLWYINHAFTHFLLKINLIDTNPGEPTQISDFKLYKFLNEIPIYSKDKRGVNISILIIHVLFLLQQHKYSDIIDRVDALNQYCHRYLRKDDTFRANCFIKMLLQVPRANFNRLRTERYSKKYIDKLNSSPINVAAQGIEVEIVPYENLWQMVLSLLE